eukprot:6053363-Prymnesium_polylepis.1
MTLRPVAARSPRACAAPLLRIRHGRPQPPPRPPQAAMHCTASTRPRCCKQATLRLELAMWPRHPRAEGRAARAATEQRVAPDE